MCKIIPQGVYCELRQGHILDQSLMVLLSFPNCHEIGQNVTLRDQRITVLIKETQNKVSCSQHILTRNNKLPTLQTDLNNCFLYLHICGLA